MNENGKWAEYDEFLKEADRDNRVGDHDFLVQEVLPGVWPSGDPRCDVNGTLITANSAKVRFSWSPPPPPETLKAEAATLEMGKKKAIAGSIRIAKSLQEYYGKHVEDLAVGDVIRVKTVKTKVQNDGSGGFIRIVAILPPKGIADSAESDAPAF